MNKIKLKKLSVENFKQYDSVSFDLIDFNIKTKTTTCQAIKDATFHLSDDFNCDLPYLAYCSNNKTINEISFSYEFFDEEFNQIITYSYSKNDWNKTIKESLIIIDKNGLKHTVFSIDKNVDTRFYSDISSLKTLKKDVSFNKSISIFRYVYFNSIITEDFVYSAISKILDFFNQLVIYSDNTLSINAHVYSFDSIKTVMPSILKKIKKQSAKKSSDYLDSFIKNGNIHSVNNDLYNVSLLQDLFHLFNLDNQKFFIQETINGDFLYSSNNEDIPFHLTASSTEKELVFLWLSLTTLNIFNSEKSQSLFILDDCYKLKSINEKKLRSFLDKKVCRYILL